MPIETGPAASAQAGRTACHDRFVRFARTIRDLATQNFFLRQEDWAVVGRDPIISRSLKLCLVVGVLMVFYNTETNIATDTFAIFDLAVFVIAVIVIMIMFTRAIKYFNFSISSLALFMNIGYVSSNTRLVIMYPALHDPPSIAFSIIYFLLNSAIFRRPGAMILNALVYCTATFMMVRYLEYLPDVHFFEPPASVIVNMWLLSTGTLATQYFAIHAREHSLFKLAEAQRKVSDLELNRDLLKENAKIRDELARFSRISVVEAMATTISHEMNQPIGSALTFAQAARRWLKRPEPNSAEAITAINGVIEQVGRAGDIMASIRRMTARDPGLLRETNVIGLVASLIPIIGVYTRDKGVTIGFIKPDAGETLNAAVRDNDISRVVMNLVQNSVDAFDDNQMSKQIEISCLSPEPGWICIVVKDNAAGISEQNLAAVFDVFYTSKIGGTGLGLPICREIAELHGGSLIVESAPGAGTIATLRIPQSPPAR